MKNSNCEIKPYTDKDLSVLRDCLSAIQEHERVAVPDLRAGKEIAVGYAECLLKRVNAQNGTIFMAWHQEVAIGLICGWMDSDDDMLLAENAREHAYISDIYVVEEWRGKGVA